MRPSFNARCTAGFGIAAILACVIPWRDAGAQRLPVVVCEGDKCHLSKEDWEKLRAYHKAVREFVERVDKKNEQDAPAIAQLLQKLQSCTAILEERKT